MNAFQLRQQQAESDLGRMLAQRRKASQLKAVGRASWSSWAEGPRWMIAEFDAGVNAARLTRVYWREHKVGWFRVRVVFEVAGPEPRVRSFRSAVEKWAERFDGASV